MYFTTCYITFTVNLLDLSSLFMQHPKIHTQLQRKDKYPYSMGMAVLPFPPLTYTMITWKVNGIVTPQYSLQCLCMYLKA